MSVGEGLRSTFETEGRWDVRGLWLGLLERKRKFRDVTTREAAFSTLLELLGQRGQRKGEKSAGVAKEGNFSFSTNKTQTCFRIYIWVRVVKVTSAKYTNIARSWHAVCSKAGCFQAEEKTCRNFNFCGDETVTLMSTKEGSERMKHLLLHHFRRYFVLVISHMSNGYTWIYQVLIFSSAVHHA